jgi:hypothetical protein
MEGLGVCDSTGRARVVVSAARRRARMEVSFMVCLVSGYAVEWEDRCKC